MNIDESVLESFKAGIEKDWEKALIFICPAIEATARKTHGKSKVTKEEFKEFLRDRNRIIEAFVGVGLNLDETRFPNTRIETDGGRLITEPDFADIVYHAFRCAGAHGHAIAKEFSFIEAISAEPATWLIGAGDGRIHMPDKVVWALIACVVFAEANNDIETTTALFLTWGGGATGRGDPYRFDIDLWWGCEEILKRFLLRKNLTRVALKFSG
jgi:hypothetical protein